MLELLKLSNFQKFRKYLLEFDPLATTIVGDSDKGKSTLLRALGFVLLNRSIRGPLAHKNRDLTKVSVKIDGKRVTRTKGKKTNKYGFDGQVYAAFGKGNVPDDIAAFLNVGPDNFQRQLDTHFWFGDTAGQVGKKLNEIVNLEVIDRSLSNLVRELNEAKSRVREFDDRVKVGREAKKDLKWVLTFDRELRALEGKEAAWQETALECSVLRKGVSAAAFHSRAAKNADTGFLEGQKCLLLGRKTARTAQEAKALREAVRDLERAEKAAGWEVPDISPLLAVRKHADAVAEERRELEGLIGELKQLEDEECGRQKELASLKSRLLKIGPRCPKCGQVIPAVPSSSASPTCTSPHDPRYSARRSLTGIDAKRPKSNKS